MRIAMVSPGLPPGGGGIGAYTDKTSRALAARGHDVHVLVPGGADGVETVNGVHVHSVATPRLRPWVLARTWAVSRALRRLGPFEIVQACEWGGEALWYSLRPAAPLITRLATPHFLIEQLNDVPVWQRRRQMFSRVLELWQARLSAQVISPSTVLAREVAARWHIALRDIAIVPTGIRTPDTRAEDAPAELRDLPYVLYFGRLEQRKGVDTWINALPAVLTADPALHAVFVGEDMGLQGRPFREYARGRCAGLTDRLHFVDPMPQQQLFPIVAGARLVVMPSRWESLANALLEAMALGRVVVASSGSGFDEVITDGVDGLLVPPGDSEALGRVVSTVLADGAALTRIGEAARRRARQYDLDAMIDELIGVYERVRPPAAALPQALSA
jgi:glycosyltransferase involved in cell wall biosynthesis